VALSARYLVDKSALARFTIPAVEARLRPLIEDGDVATCAIVDLEVLYSSRNLVDYEDVLQERLSLDAAPITPDVMALAIDLQYGRRCRSRVGRPAGLDLSGTELGRRMPATGCRRHLEAVGSLEAAPEVKEEALWLQLWTEQSKPARSSTRSSPSG
jgi:predicted nucleic acid-binding protein